MSTNPRKHNLSRPTSQEQQALRQSLRSPDDNLYSGRSSRDASTRGSFLEQVAGGIQEQDRAMMRNEVIRYASFFWAVINW